MESEITKGEFTAELNGNTSRVKNENNTYVALMISGEKYYCDERLKGESWLDMRERTKSDRVKEEKEVEANALFISMCFNLAQKYPNFNEWASIFEQHERMKELLAEIIECQFSKNGTLSSLNGAVANGRDFLNSLKQ